MGKRYVPIGRYKLRNLTVEQARALLEKHEHRIAPAAAELGVTYQALNRWLRLHKCQRTTTFFCDDASMSK